MKSKSKFMVMLLLSFVLLFQGMLTTSAANTVFDVPTISFDIKPDNMIYQSPNLNIIASDWPYGLDANVINTSNLDDLIDELNANVSTSGHSSANVSFYPNGANLSDANVAALRDAGWNELSLYYYDFFLIGGMPETGLSPNIELTESAEIAEALEGICNMDEVAVVSISGVNMNPVNMSLYSKKFDFLDADFQAYKYIADVERFVPVEKYFIGLYGPNVFEMFDLQNIENDVNGLYIALNEGLPAELVTTSEELPVLRENMQQIEAEVPAASGQTTTEKQQETVEQHSTEIQQSSSEKTSEENSVDLESLYSEREENLQKDDPLILANKDESVEWIFAGRVSPEGFTPEAAITLLNDKELSVDFAYSGELPEGTQVTIVIPEEATYFFNSGDDLFLYYCDPENALREYVGKGRCEMEAGTSGRTLVTFDIYHCSEYIITYDYQGESYTTIDTGVPTSLYIAVIIGVVLLCVAGVLIYRKIKKEKELLAVDIWYDPTLKTDRFRG